MDTFEQQAIKLLKKSLTPIPQELNEIDWKEKLSSNNKRTSEHLSGFANHPGGGWLIFGINDKTGQAVGVDKNQSTQIVEKIANLARDTLNPFVQIRHAIIEFNQKPLLAIHIKESAIKPVHIKTGTLEDCFIRSGGTTRKASRHELGSLMLNSKYLRWEELHATKLLSPSEILTSLDHSSICLLLGRPIPTEPAEIMNWLEEEKMLKKINNSGFYITNFGAIAASRNLNSFDDLSRKSIRIIKYKGLNKNITEKEFPGQKGYAIGFEGLIDFLKALLPTSEIIMTALRKETSVYPEIALRELIANALIHQDFTIRGSGPVVEIFDDRIEITSPGKLLPTKKIDRLIGTNPESRNEILAAAFRRYHICEERGSGFEKTVTAIELFGLPPLHFEEGENYFRVTMYSPKTFSQMTPQERIDACYQHAVIRYLSSNALTNTSLRERLKMSERKRPMVSKVIKEAIDNNVIKQKNPQNKSIKFAEYLPYWA